MHAGLWTARQAGRGRPSPVPWGPREKAFPKPAPSALPERPRQFLRSFHEKATVFIHNPDTSLRFPKPTVSEAQRIHSGPEQRSPSQMASHTFTNDPRLLCAQRPSDQREHQTGNGGVRRSTGFSHGSFQGDSGDSIPSTAVLQRVARPPRAASPAPPPLPQHASACTCVHRDTRTHTLRANHGAVRGGDTRSQRFSFTLLAKKFHRPTGTHFSRKSNKYKRFPLLGWEVKVENMF